MPAGEKATGWDNREGEVSEHSTLTHNLSAWSFQVDQVNEKD